MAEITLKATTGRETGTGPAKRLRAEGKIPAVVYGLGADPVAVSVDWRPLREALITEAGLNALIDLDIDGEVALTIVKELQRHPIRRNVLHVDFLRVSADAEISVEVPIVLTGEAKAVASDNGVVDQMLNALLINAKPADIPTEIAIDISDLQVGDAVRVSDLPLPAGVTTDVDGDDPVVTASAGAPAEAPEGEGGEAEAAEGGDAAAEASSEGGDEG